MPKASLTSLLLGVAALLSGCQSCESLCQETLCSFRDHHEAKMAWWAARGCYVECQPHLHHFGWGYMDGYRAVAAGGDGCPPMMPPQKMWGPCYQTCEGREKVVAWYNGYSHGVYAAQCDGVAQMNSMVTSRDLYGNSCRNAPVVLDLTQFESGETNASEPELLGAPPLNLPSEPIDAMPVPSGDYSPGILPPAPGMRLAP